MEAFVDPGVYGGIIGKSISQLPRGGNPIPRVAETPAGMLNSIGLQNPGFEGFMKDYLPRMRDYGTVLVVNLVGDTIDEYVEMARRLNEEEAVDAIELNISCPNCPEGGMEFGIDPRATEILVGKVREVYKRPILAKLTPNVTDICSIASAAEQGGADILALVNTYLGIAVDWRARKTILPGVTGGMSGPAIKPLALRAVWSVARSSSLPILGMGGISSADDVLEFMAAGASAVQIGTIQFVRPKAVLEILSDLERYLSEMGVTDISEMVGTLHSDFVVR